MTLKLLEADEVLRDVEEAKCNCTSTLVFFFMSEKVRDV